MAALLQTYTYRDAAGYTATLRFFVPDEAAGAALSGPLNDTTNALLQAVHGPYTLPGSDLFFGAAATYQSIADKAAMVFVAADGSRHIYRIPAPLAELFDTDGETVLKTDARVIAFKDAVIANCVTESDAAFSTFAGGFRSKTRTRRRLTTFIALP